MADVLPTVEETSSPRKVVLDKIQAIQDPTIKITINPGFEDVKTSYPPQSEVLLNVQKRYGDSAKVIMSMVPLFYDFLKMPIINYPGEPIDENIDRVDKAIVDLFSDQQEKDAADALLQENRMRPNKLLHVSPNLDLLYEIIKEDTDQKDDANKILRIFNSLSPIVDLKNTENQSTYKRMSPEEKRTVVKQYTKAAEICLRVLAGESIPEEDWKYLETHRIDKH